MESMTTTTRFISMAAAVMTAMHRKQKSDEPQPDGGDKE